MSRARIAIAALSISGLAFVGLIADEGYTDKAIVPTQGDVPTFGFGNTVKEDGSKVRMGDTTTPTKAARLSIQHIGKDEAVLKRCVTAPLLQAEYDQLVKHAYQYGPAKTCSSSVVRLLNQQRYIESCEAHLEWRKIRPGPVRPDQGVVDGQGLYDCSQFVNGRPNKMCWGVWERAKERRDECARANGVTPALGATG